MSFLGGSAADYRIAQEALGKGAGDLNQALSGYRTSFDKIKAQNAEIFVREMAGYMNEDRELNAETIMQRAQDLNLNEADVAGALQLLQGFRQFKQEREQQKERQRAIKTAPDDYTKNYLKAINAGFPSYPAREKKIVPKMKSLVWWQDGKKIENQFPITAYNQVREILSNKKGVTFEDPLDKKRKKQQIDLAEKKHNLRVDEIAENKRRYDEAQGLKKNEIKRKTQKQIFDTLYKPYSTSLEALDPNKQKDLWNRAKQITDLVFDEGMNIADAFVEIVGKAKSDPVGLR